MTDLENKARMRGYYHDVWERGDLSIADDMLDSDYLDRTPPRGMSADRDGHHQTIRLLHAAFPDLKLTVEDLIAEDDRVVGRWTLRGTHQGVIFGLSPTGKQIFLTGIDIARWRSGRIAEMWHVEDILGLLRQLGAIPSRDDA